MSVLDRERPYADLTSALRFALEQRLKEVYTVLPGIVESYDASTKRAQVRGATQIVLSDGTVRKRKPLANVPVVFAGGGGFLVHAPIAVGEPVLLFYAMRGIVEFKDSLTDAIPTPSSMLSERDAVAFAGFGARTNTPASDTGISVQTEDGTTAVIVESDRVIIRRGSQEATLTDGGLVVTDLEVTGSVQLPRDVSSGSGAGRRNIGASHKHIYPDPGPPPNQGSTGGVSPI